jgi:hypothetical protein
VKASYSATVAGGLDVTGTDKAGSLQANSGISLAAVQNALSSLILVPVGTIIAIGGAAPQQAPDLILANAIPPGPSNPCAEVVLVRLVHDCRAGRESVAQLYSGCGRTRLPAGAPEGDGFDSR